MTADSEIEPVADYDSFLAKLRSFERITEIYAKVHPPNPLFGRLWQSLNDYLRQRSASEVLIREKKEGGGSLNSGTAQLISDIQKNPDFEPEIVPAIGDAALLMAADGYGQGKVEGTAQKKHMVVRTSDSQKSFVFEKDPEPKALAEEAEAAFAQVSKERAMRHP